MAQRNYIRGRAREYRAKATCFKMGALYVQRSYGSHGIFDLIAVFPDHVRLIQVKRTYIAAWERKHLKTFAKKLVNQTCFVELWMYPNRRLRIDRLNAPNAADS